MCNHQDPFGLCPVWLDGKPCQVSFTGISISANWLTASGSISFGEYGGEGRTGLYFSSASGAGAGHVPGRAAKSWLPSASIGIDVGGHELLSSFSGPGEQENASVALAGVGLGGALLQSASGNGWSGTLGLATPGASLNGQGGRTWLLTQKKVRQAPATTKVPADATMVVFP